MNFALLWSLSISFQLYMLAVIITVSLYNHTVYTAHTTDKNTVAFCSVYSQNS